MFHCFRSNSVIWEHDESLLRSNSVIWEDYLIRMRLSSGLSAFQGTSMVRHRMAQRRKLKDSHCQEVKLQQATYLWYYCISSTIFARFPSNPSNQSFSSSQRLTATPSHNAMQLGETILLGILVLRLFLVCLSFIFYQVHLIDIELDIYFLLLNVICWLRLWCYNLNKLHHDVDNYKEIIITIIT